MNEPRGTSSETLSRATTSRDPEVKTFVKLLSLIPEVTTMVLSAVVGLLFGQLFPDRRIEQRRVGTFDAQCFDGGQILLDAVF